MHDPIALRVARRHQAAVVLREEPSTRTRIEFTDSGGITACELMKMLARSTGPLVTLRFRPSLTGLPNVIAWEALNDSVDIVTGKLVLHAAVAQAEIVTWAEVSVDQR